MTQTQMTPAVWWSSGRGGGSDPPADRQGRGPRRSVLLAPPEVPIRSRRSRQRRPCGPLHGVPGAHWVFRQAGRDTTGLVSGITRDDKCAL